MAQRKRLRIHGTNPRLMSHDEKVVMRLKEIHNCNINTAWDILKKRRFHATMTKLNAERLTA